MEKLFISMGWRIFVVRSVAWDARRRDQQLNKCSGMEQSVHATQKASIRIGA
jgi:hypothetical protein